jgi:hypothetical protein
VKEERSVEYVNIIAASHMAGNVACWVDKHIEIRDCFFPFIHSFIPPYYSVPENEA